MNSYFILLWQLKYWVDSYYVDARVLHGNLIMNVLKLSSVSLTIKYF